MRYGSSHFQFRELRESLDEPIAWSKEMGLTQMVLSTFGLPNNAPIADWMRAAGELNKIGDETRKTGTQLGFHTRGFSEVRVENRLSFLKHREYIAANPVRAGLVDLPWKWRPLLI